MIPGAIPGAMPAGDNSQVISHIRDVSSLTERFVKRLTAYLQAQGSWPPAQGTAADELCQNVQSFQLQVRKLGADVGTNVSFSNLQIEMKMIGSTSQNIDKLLAQIRVTPDISGRWNEVRISMNSAYQSFFSAYSGSADGQ
jgi:hypothetical protein